MFAYCENDPVNGIDPHGTRTYFLNGINNTASGGITDYAKNFQKKLSSVKDFKIIPLYEGIGTIKGVWQVVLETFNIDVYTNRVISIIKKDLKKKPLAKGEQLNLIGYSGGGQIALNVMAKMKNQITNVVLIGAPVNKVWRSTTKVSVIYSYGDPLSWTVGYGFKSYCAGRFGHTDYFIKKNINTVANIVKKIIR